MKFKDLTGKRFGRLEVLSRVHLEDKTKTLWKCLCDCGNTSEIYRQNLVKGSTKSCGCIAREVTSNRSKTHGLSGHRLYDTWNRMLRRCNNPSDSVWEHYGQRGVNVSEHWLDFNNFIADMNTSYETGFTLERIDVNGNYCKENCKWLLRSLQSKNKRMYKTNKVGVSGVSIVVNKGVPTGRASVQNNFERIRKSWSINKYGESEALRLASVWVKEKYLELDFGITHGSI